jgi:hypothetical protein
MRTVLLAALVVGGIGLCGASTSLGAPANGAAIANVAEDDLERPGGPPLLLSSLARHEPLPVPALGPLLIAGR